MKRPHGLDVSRPLTPLQAGIDQKRVRHKTGYRQAIQDSFLGHVTQRLAYALI